MRVGGPNLMRNHRNGRAPIARMSRTMPADAGRSALVRLEERTRVGGLGCYGSPYLEGEVYVRTREPCPMSPRRVRRDV